MPATVFVITPDSNERRWVEATLAHRVVEFVDDAAAWLARLPAPEPACLVMSAEPDPDAALRLVCDVRARDATLPIVVLGLHTAFRTAVDIARFPGTDFLERPVSQRQLRIAVSSALQAIGG